jgi:hypothetical protein|tara:strand:+ start:504 stop:995 length:492 start_codon:yes stop_codon:yes gene_type:complete
MALFGSSRDVSTFKGIAKELLENVISQQVGYYKYMLNDTTVNVYGEGMNRYYIGPILINCLIERGDFSTVTKEQVLDVARPATFRFLKDHLQDANVVPEIGDILMYNELYYEVDNVNQNQLILGKDPNYAYSEGLNEFGSSFSIIVTTHYTSGDKLGITKQRL